MCTYTYTCTYICISIVVVVIVQSLSCVQLFIAYQAPLTFTVSWSLLQFMSIQLVMLSNHLILYHSLFFCLQSFSPSESFPMALCIRQPKYWNFSFSLSPSSEYSGLISFRIDWLDLAASVLQCSAFFMVQFLHDYWRNHRFDSTDLCWQLCLCF